MKEKKKKEKKNTLPILCMVGPTSLWLLFFLLIPLIYVVVISFMTKGAYGGVVGKFSIDSYKKLLDPVYLTVMWICFIAGKGAANYPGNAHASHHAAILGKWSYQTEWMVKYTERQRLCKYIVDEDRNHRPADADDVLGGGGPLWNGVYLLPVHGSSAAEQHIKARPLAG